MAIFTRKLPKGRCTSVAMELRSCLSTSYYLTKRHQSRLGSDGLLVVKELRKKQTALFQKLFKTTSEMTDAEFWELCQGLIWVIREFAFTSKPLSYILIHLIGYRQVPPRTMPQEVRAWLQS
ncbi:MAG: hypothetical protein M1355_00370 [Patescibacteria group bacterium]|nr:hypothetical protein [Patescibacteria group bacterium]